MSKIKFTGPLEVYNSKTKEWEIPKAYFCKLCKNTFIKYGGGGVDLEERHNKILHNDIRQSLNT